MSELREHGSGSARGHGSARELGSPPVLRAMRGLPAGGTSAGPGGSPTRRARPAVRYPIPRALSDMDPARHQVVEASAGTGKTYLIEHRIVDLLLTTDTPIEQILVVTFTDKATAELRFRVRRLLDRILTLRPESAPAIPDGEPSWTIDADARRVLSDALMGFDRAAIYTIHGFCQRVLTENAFASRRLFDQTQVASEEVFGDAFRDALREQFARDPDDRAYLVAWFHSGRSVEDLEQLLYKCAAQSGRMVPAYSAEALAAVLARAAHALPAFADEDAVSRGLRAGMRAQTAGGVARRLVALAKTIAAWAEQHLGGYVRQADSQLELDGARAGAWLGVVADGESPVGRAGTVSREGPPEFLAALEVADREFTGNERLLAFLRTRLDAAPPTTPLLARAHEVVCALDDAVLPLDAAVAQRFLPKVEARLDADKQRRGEFDFQDMLRLVWDSLEGPGGGELAARLRARYRFALIDEFQDTDDLQWKIFRRLYLEAPQGVSAERDGDDDEGDSDARPGSLCIIGDPKQAIYSFRGADVFTYLQARREMREAGGQVTNLIDNYRSTADVIAAYNMVFEERFGMRFFTGDIRYDHPVRAATEIAALGPAPADDAVAIIDAGHAPEAGADAGSPIAPVRVFRVRPERGKLRADALRRVLLQRITSEIRDLILDGEHEIRVGVPGAMRPVRAGDIFVLTRTTAESNDVAEVLQQAGLPCAIYKQEGLFQTAEAAEVRDLLAGIAEPRSRAARFKAWNTRFFGVELSDLSALADLPETHPLVSRLYEWKALADRLAYEELFAAILADSGLVERELFLETSERALTNFAHLFELLLEEVVSSRCELHELVQRLHRWITRAVDGYVDDRNIQRMESERSAVQIMTIHRAKGLEAKVVFLYGGFGGRRGDRVHVYHDGGERLIHIGHAGEDIKRQARAEADSEDQRLLYVALTRAVARLYLPYVAPEDYKVHGAYAQLNRRLEPILRQVAIDPEVARLFAVEDVTTGRPQLSVIRSSPAEGWEPPAQLVLPADPAADPYVEARDRRAGFVVTSYTRMKGDAPVVPWRSSRKTSSGSGRAAVPEPVRAVDFKIDRGGDELEADELEGGALAAGAVEGERDLPESREPDAGDDVREADSADSAGSGEADAGDGVREADSADSAAPGAGAGAAGIDAAEDEDDARPARHGELPGGSDSGIFLHELLEHLPLDTVTRATSFAHWRRMREVDQLFAEAMLRHDREPRFKRYAQWVIWSSVSSPLPCGAVTVPSVAHSGRTIRELEFLYPIPPRPSPASSSSAPTSPGSRPPAGDAPAPRNVHSPIQVERGYIKGFIDLVFEWEGRVYLVDWKSDILPDYGADALLGHVAQNYDLQAQLYSLALAKILELSTADDHERRFGGLLYCFIRGMGAGAAGTRGAGVYFRRPSFSDIAAVERALAAREDFS